MVITPDLLDAMLANGLSREQIVGLMKASVAAEQAAEEAKKAARRANQNERQQRRRRLMSHVVTHQTCDNVCDGVTERDTPAPSLNGRPPSPTPQPPTLYPSPTPGSDAAASAAAAAAPANLSVSDQIWTRFPIILVDLSGKSDRSVRTWIGKLLSKYRPEDVLPALQAAVDARTGDPFGYATRVLNPAPTKQALKARPPSAQDLWAADAVEANQSRQRGRNDEGPFDPSRAEPEVRLPGIRNGIPPAPARTAALIGYLHNNLEPIPGNFRRYALSAAAAPTDEQRALLLTRRGEIDAGLVGADEITIRENVGILRSSMATAQLGPEAVKLAKQGFILVLGQYPAWAVQETTLRFLSGRAGSGTYAPTAAEMANVCRELISDHLAERARINAVLDAEVYHLTSEADRAAINRMHADFVAETTARSAAPKGHAPEPLPERRPAGLAADLEMRRARREAAERAADGGATPPQAHPAA